MRREPRVSPGGGPGGGRGFTLLELLVVAGLMAGLSFALLGGLGGGGRSAALQAGQATVANLVNVARTRAMATGHSVRLLFHADLRMATRFRRMIVLQEEVAAGSWQTRETVALPEGVFVLPHASQIPPGFFAGGVAWTNGVGEALASSALFVAPLMLAADMNEAEAWNVLSFGAAGTIAGGGNLVLAAGRGRPPGTVAAGESPVQVEGPEAVRGIALSGYGLARMVNERAGF